MPHTDHRDDAGRAPATPAKSTRPRAAGLRAAICAALLLAAGGSHGAQSAAEDPAVEDARFDLYFGGIRAGAAQLTFTYEGDGYAARARGETAGVVGAFYGASYEAEAQGALGPTTRPRKFTVLHSFGGKTQALTIEFGLTAPSAVDSDPPFKPKPYQIDPTEQSGVLDPLSAAAALLRPAPAAAICGREADVFDGRRRSRIILDAPRMSGDEILCTARFKRVAGYRPKDRKAEDIPFRLYFSADDAGIARISRVVVETGWGQAVALRAK